MWNIAWSCPTISNSCKLDTNIQRWQSIHCRYTSQWTLCVHTDMFVTITELWMDDNTLDSEGINWAYRDLWDYSTINFMSAVNNMQDCCQVGSASFKLGASVDTLWDVSMCPAASLRTTRFNIQKFYKVLALHRVFCTDIRTDSDFCFIQH